MAIINMSSSFLTAEQADNKTQPDKLSAKPSSSGKTSADNVRTVGTVSSIDSQKTPSVENSLNDEAAISQIEEFQNFSASINRSLQFKVDEELGVTIVRVVDKQTEELIRQFPPEELLNLSKRLQELNEDIADTRGIILQQKV